MSAYTNIGMIRRSGYDIFGEGSKIRGTRNLLDIYKTSSLIVLVTYVSPFAVSFQIVQSRGRNVCAIPGLRCGSVFGSLVRPKARQRAPHFYGASLIAKRATIYFILWVRRGFDDALIVTGVFGQHSNSSLPFRSFPAHFVVLTQYFTAHSTIMYGTGYFRAAGELHSCRRSQTERHAISCKNGASACPPRGLQLRHLGCISLI